MVLLRSYFGAGVALMLMGFSSQIVQAEQPALGPQPSEFNYANYQPTDLDKLIERKRPLSGVDLHPGLPLKIIGKLESYGQPCNNGYLKIAMEMVDLWNDSVPITRCIKVRSAKNRVVTLYIQDRVADFLPKEIPLGGDVILFVIHVFTTPDGMGLLVNEFSEGGAPNK